MRTTLEIDDDVLAAAKELAEFEKTTAGRVLSRLARRGLSTENSGKERKMSYRNGVPVLPLRNEIVTMEHVQRIMDEEGI